jgi:hypothetical protein
MTASYLKTIKMRHKRRGISAAELTTITAVLFLESRNFWPESLLAFAQQSPKIHGICATMVKPECV